MFGFLKKKSRKADESAQPAREVPEREETAEQAEDAAVSDDMPGGVPGDTQTVEAARVGLSETVPEAVEQEQSAPDPAPPAAMDAASVDRKKLSWGERLKSGLSRTREQLGGGLADFFGFRKIDEDFLDDLETTLLTADCGVEATQHLMDEVRRCWVKDSLQTTDQLQKALAESLRKMLRPLEQPLDVSGHCPFIIMIAGVNGSGKTTSIGKLAKRFQNEGKSVLLAAGDTFRAAAREQLQTWGERNGVTVIAQEGGDSAAVIFDAVNAAKSRGIDVVLADTAGRLPTQLHLMEEIAKVRRVIAKVEPEAPHEVMLVLDANVGQNALAQVKAFDEALGVTGLVLTKLDGTAKGGVVAALARQYPRPLRFIGVGEGIDDLQPFHVDEFVDALFARASGQPEVHDR